MTVMMLNRGEQWRALNERLGSCTQSGGDGRLLVVVRGTPKDKPDLFAYRCGIIDLKKFDTDTGWQFMGPLEWPSGSSDLNALIATIRPNLGINGSCSLLSFNDRVKDLGKSICFSHSIDEPEISKAGEALVYRWLEYFATEWPRPPAGRLVVAFLCIRATAEAGSPEPDLHTRIAEKYTSNNCPIFVLPPLGLIKRHEVLTWTSVVRENLGEECAAGVMLDAEDIFDRINEWRFDDLSKRLRPIIGGTIHPHSQLNAHRE
ncbi:hypothetical protein [Caballeronia sp. dw_19]|uniref:hypothetical protein n=1 Tax=Caballeronia sp. dw_19 TaxID=2719791 RepID=UPI001BD2F867|nr:hypothetical protein [Caballeronia sp. dw_19]